MAGLGAILQCGDMIGRRISGLLRNEERLAKFSFAHPYLLWQGRRWRVSVFLTSATNSDGEVFGLGLTRPDRAFGTFEQLINVEEFRRVQPGIPRQALRRLLGQYADIVDRDGPLTEAASRRLQEALVTAEPDLQAILDELSGAIDVPTPTGAAAELLGWEKDATGTLLEIAGLNREVLRSWRPEPEPVPFLSGLPGVLPGEDTLIAHDSERFPEWIGMDAEQIGWRVFYRGDQRMFVANVNRWPVEHTLGVDLVYYHEYHGSFILVQYKKLRRDRGDEVLGYRPDERLDEQLGRMREVDAVCAQAPNRDSDFRLLPTPCWIKLCWPQPLIVGSSALIEGMYLAREHFEQLLDDPSLRGPQGGVRLGFHNVPRYLNMTMFTKLVGDGWVGTRGTGTEFVAAQIQASLGMGRAVVVGVHSTPHPLGNGLRRRRIPRAQP